MWCIWHTLCAAIKTIRRIKSTRIDASISVYSSRRFFRRIGFNSRWPTILPFISLQNWFQRLLLAKEHRHWTLHVWKKFCTVWRVHISFTSRLRQSPCVVCKQREAKDSACSLKNATAGGVPDIHLVRSSIGNIHRYLWLLLHFHWLRALVHDYNAFRRSWLFSAGLSFTTSDQSAIELES